MCKLFYLMHVDDNYAHYYLVDLDLVIHSDCTFANHQPLNKCRNLDSVQYPCNNRDDSLADRRANNCPAFVASICSCK